MIYFLPIWLNQHVEAGEEIVNGKKIDIVHVQNLMKSLTALLRTKPNVANYSTKMVELRGDTHGQLSDLVYILTRQGMPNENNMYLFNGDFVDRGLFGTEVFVILSALKIANLSCIFKRITKVRNMMLFMNLKKKLLKNMIKKLYISKHVLIFLPLCAVLNKVFVVHGGLPRNRKITLRHINHIHQTLKYHQN